MFEVNLRSQVPFYFKDDPNWGGPAVVQMAMNGYPPGATSCYIDQTTIWNYIQANNQEGGTGPWGIGWYSDPFAVTKALNDLCPPTGHWIDVSDTDKMKVLYTLLRWMASYNYPSPICFNAHDEWALITDYRTSDDPRLVTNPTLERIGYNIPGQYYENSPADLFLNGPYRWGLPCDGSTCGQRWNNKYVGIGEPPLEEGSVRVEKVSRVGKKLISLNDAAVIARKFLRELRREKSDFILKRTTGVRAGRPMLVRELPMIRTKKKSEENVHYYLVPFAQKNEVDKLNTPLARLSVLVNAYTGRYEGLSVFPRPVRYLQPREALKIAMKNMSLSRRDESRIRAELIFKPLQSHVSSALPAWRFAIGERELFVTQNATVLGTLNYRTYRGA